MSGLRFILVLSITTVLSTTASADADGHDHVHSTSVGDSGGMSLSQAAAQAPSQLLAGTSFQPQQASVGEDIPDLEDAIRVQGNGEGVDSKWDRIGQPGVEIREAAPMLVPRTRVQTRSPASDSESEE